MGRIIDEISKSKRPLDLMYAIYVLGWWFQTTDGTPGRKLLRPTSDSKGEPDMLPYFRDDIRFVIDGIEELKKHGIYLNILPTKKSYYIKVTGRISNLYVEERHLSTGIIATALLTMGIKHQDIQAAIDRQDDNTQDYWKRKQSERKKGYGGSYKGQAPGNSQSQGRKTVL